MVCLGNICRSPVAEGIMRRKIKEYGIDAEVDSAGTGGWHAGESPDDRMTGVARRFGTDISTQRARKFSVADFHRFDRIYVMDRSNYSDVLHLAQNEEETCKVDMLLNVIYPGKNMDVPDPYYGGREGFENVYRLVDAACEKIAQELQKM